MSSAVVAQSTHCFAFVGKPHDGIRELAERDSACTPRESSRRMEQSQQHTGKIMLLLSMCLIRPWTFSFKNKMFSQRSQVPRLPGEVATQGACLLPAHLAGKPEQHRSRRDGQPRSQSACLPAKTGELPACQSRALGIPGGARSSQAAGRLWEQGSPMSLEPWGRRSWKRRELDLVVHPGGCQEGGQLLSLEAGKQPGRQGGRLHLTQPNQGFLDLSPQNLSGGNWFCARIYYLLCLGLPRPWYLEEKFIKVTIGRESSQHEFKLS